MRAISSAIRVPASMLARSSSVVRKLHTTTGLESGRGVRRRTLPRLVGLITTGPKQKPESCGAVSPSSKNSDGQKWNCTSGASRPGRVRMNAAPSGKFEVSGPRPCASSSKFSGVSVPNSVGSSVR